MGYKYLASPYSSPDHEVRDRRVEVVIAASAWLFQKGIFNFSPIVHCHPVATRYSLPGDANYWKEYNQTMLRYSDGMLVLQSEGWRDSHGVKMEIEFANMLGLKINGIQVLTEGEFKLT